MWSWQEAPHPKRLSRLEVHDVREVCGDLGHEQNQRLLVHFATTTTTRPEPINHMSTRHKTTQVKRQAAAAVPP